MGICLKGEAIRMNQSLLLVVGLVTGRLFVGGMLILAGVPMSWSKEGWPGC
jgi:hypothetical protein